MNIPGYNIERELGRGGMATVYLATQMALDRRVAVKVLHANLVSDLDLVQRFMQEGKTHASFDHPQIVRIYEVGQNTESLPFITMEYLEGQTFKDYLKQIGSCPSRQLIDLLAPLHDALKYIHDKRYVHRDVKPENIFLCQNRGAVLMDFGITREVDRSTRFTEAGMAIGTPHYMSPEQARGEKTDHRTDLYALGVMLYEGLTGRVPFDAADSFAIAIKHIQEQVPRLPESLQNFQPFLDRAMCKNPDQRYACAQEMKRDLVLALDGRHQSNMEELPLGGTEILKAVPGSTEAKAKSRVAVFAVAAVVMVALVGAGGWYFLHGSRPQVRNIGGGGGSSVPSQIVISDKLPDSPPVEDQTRSDIDDQTRELLGAQPPSLEDVWREAAVNATADPFATLNKLIELTATPEFASLPAARRKVLLGELDKTALTGVEAHLGAAHLLSPAGNCAADLIKHWQAAAGDRGAVEQAISQGLSWYVDKALRAEAEGKLKKADGYLRAADKFANLSYDRGKALLADTEHAVVKLKLTTRATAAREQELQRSQMAEQARREQELQRSQKAKQAHLELEKAWEYLDAGDYSAARRAIRVAEEMGALKTELDGARRATENAVALLLRQAETLLDKASQAYDQERFSQAVEFCNEAEKVYPFSQNLNMSVCQSAEREKSSLTQTWTSQNIGGAVGHQKTK